MKTLLELEFWLIGYGLSNKEAIKVIAYIERNKK
jgi:hypothetical protein